jgi:hypothetical protein
MPKPTPSVVIRRPRPDRGASTEVEFVANRNLPPLAGERSENENP